jgi:uncharacterized protein (UPF0332 family)
MAYDKAVLIEYRIGRAHETAAEARWAYDSDHLSLAENRIYYAMFYMLRALALKHDFRTSKHAQLVGWFNKEFVRPGIVDVDIGKRVQAAFDKRQEGDYDDFVVFEKEEAEADLMGMENFLASVEQLVRADAVR